MASDIFGGNGSISALFGIEDNGSTVTFSNLGGDSLKLGFLVESYRVSWGRQIQVKRVFNLSGKIAIAGSGNGTLELTGLVGTAKEFKELIEKTSNSDICEQIVCEITANSGFAVCQDNKTAKQEGAMKINCKSVMLSSIGLGGAISDNNALITQGSLTFQISGLTIEAVDTNSSTQSNVNNGQSNVS